MGTLKYDDLSKKYREFDVPTYKIKVGGKEIPQADVTISNIEVNISTGFEASMCSFEVFELYDIDERAFDAKLMKAYFALGKEVEVSLGYIETTLVFKGYIETVSAIFSETQFPYISVECLDVKGLMMHGNKSTAMNLGSYTDAVNSILGNYGSLAGTKTVDASTKLEREIQQNKETDYAFLCRVARSIHYEFFVLQGKVYFRKPAYADQTPQLLYEWGQMLVSFNQTRTLSKYVNKVTVKGYNDTEHKMIESTASAPIKIGSGSQKPDQFASQLKSATTVIVDMAINTVEEAKERAEAELNQRSINFITGYGKSVGIPELVPGKYIEIKSFDGDVDNKYYVTKVVHRLNDGEYNTEFEAGVNML
ncbi:phage late control D family protein [Fusibacter sp. 3D3]|uniref:phage late control D family protein n=1 Tax=Fusibacter sp. 3D3 TaxID=1048380 RepID=UPI000852D2CA|nr:phage late control D family protein [Fusibacter sp. 3D3]GAU77509.1 phage protein D [Fusibacter sp. 3D3]